MKQNKLQELNQLLNEQCEEQVKKVVKEVIEEMLELFFNNKIWTKAYGKKNTREMLFKKYGIE